MIPHIHAHLYKIKSDGKIDQATMFNIWAPNIYAKYTPGQIKMIESYAQKKYSYDFAGNYDDIVKQWQNQWRTKQANLSVFTNNCADDSYCIVKNILKIPIRPRKFKPINFCKRLLPTMPEDAFNDIKAVLEKVTEDKKSTPML